MKESIVNVNNLHTRHIFSNGMLIMTPRTHRLLSSTEKKKYYVEAKPDDFVGNELEVHDNNSNKKKIFIKKE